MNVEEKKKTVNTGKNKEDKSNKKKRKQKSTYQVLDEKAIKKVKYGYDDWCDQFILNDTFKEIEMDMEDLLNILTSTMDTLLMYEVAIIRNPRTLENQRIQVYIKKRVRNILNVAYLWHTNPGLFDLASDISKEPYEVIDYNEIVHCAATIVQFDFRRGIKEMEQEMLRLLRQLQYRCVLYFDFDRFNKKVGRNGKVGYCDATFKNPLKQQPVAIGNVVKIDKNELRKEVELCNYYPLCKEHGLFKGPVCEKCLKDYNQMIMKKEVERMAKKYGGEQNLWVERDGEGNIVRIQATGQNVSDMAITIKDAKMRYESKL